MHCSSKKSYRQEKLLFFFLSAQLQFLFRIFFFLVKTMKYGLVTKGCRRTDKSINRWQDLTLLFLIYRWHDTQFIASRFYSWGCEFFAKHIIFRSMRKLEPHLCNIKKKRNATVFFSLQAKLKPPQWKGTQKLALLKPTGMPELERPNAKRLPWTWNTIQIPKLRTIQEPSNFKRPISTRRLILL